MGKPTQAQQQRPTSSKKKPQPVQPAAPAKEELPIEAEEQPVKAKRRSHRRGRGRGKNAEKAASEPGTESNLAEATTPPPVRTAVPKEERAALEEAVSTLHKIASGMLLSELAGDESESIAV